MNGATDSLAGLRPLHQPPPVSWWPPAVGWWIVLLLVVAGSFVIVRFIRRNAARRAALRELKNIRENTNNLELLAVSINTLLKRYALICYPRAEVAGLNGKDWYIFLGNKISAKGKAILSDNFSAFFQEDVYKNKINVDRKRLLTFARLWIKSNRPAKQKRKKISR